MKITLNVWRQPASEAKGKLETYTLSDVSGDMSFLEMFDMLNEQLDGLVTNVLEPAQALA